MNESGRTVMDYVDREGFYRAWDSLGSGRQQVLRPYLKDEAEEWLKDRETISEARRAIEEDDLTEIVEHHKQVARERGWMVGDINQTDTWFRN
jgi:hypothetical protein